MTFLHPPLVKSEGSNESLRWRFVPKDVLVLGWMHEVYHLFFFHQLDLGLFPMGGGGRLNWVYRGVAK